jgi:hypothetical protein
MNMNAMRPKKQRSRLRLCLIPDEAPIRRLSEGDYVKLSFDTTRHVSEDTREFFRREGVPVPGESFWVQITDINGRWPLLRMRGEVADHPVLIDPSFLRIGSPLEFTPEHILDISLQEGTLQL